MTRSANGESSIYMGSDGRWHGWVSVGKREAGVPDRRHLTGKTRAVVVRKVRDLEAKRDAGRAAQVGRPPTVGEWMDHWLTHIAERRVRPLTLQGYQTTVRLHIRPALGHHRLDRLQPEHLESLYLAMQDRASACWRPRTSCATRPAGLMRWPSGCGSPKRWG